MTDRYDPFANLVDDPELLASKPELPESYKPTEFTEPCPKCRGTGRFYSYTGRIIGECFTCKGAGKKTFKKPAADRAVARDKAKARKAARLAEEVGKFREMYPDIAEWMDGSTFSFAVAMREALAKYGWLTERQIEASRSAIAKLAAAKAAAVERKANAPEIDLSKITAAFAKLGGNKPTLRFLGLTISLAPSHGKNAGALYVKNDNAYLGKITGGKFFATRDCSDADKAKLLDAANDPLSAAIAYGKATTHCCVCGRHLTDPGSVERGIGPICESKFE